MLKGIALACIVSLALGACGSSKCKKACKHIEQCVAEGNTAGDGGEKTDDAPPQGDNGSASPITCNLSKECTPLEKCQALCILEASCDALLGKDQQGAQDLASCSTACAEENPPTDGTVVWLDTGPDQDGQILPQDAFLAKDETVDLCEPQCTGKQCGDNGCGGTCGTCPTGQTCNTSGQCVDNPTGSNSGKVCPEADPSCPVGESCLLMEQTAVDGMCLAKCSNPGDPCPVPNSATMYAICAFSAGTTTEYYCGFLCEAQGQTYSCPNATDYKCEIFDTNQPDFKFCMPN